MDQGQPMMQPPMGGGGGTPPMGMGGPQGPQGGAGGPEGMPGMAPPQDPIDQQQLPMDPSGQLPEQDDDDAKFKNVVDYALSVANLAKGLVDKEDKEGNNILDKMGSEVFEGYQQDEASRADWLKKNEEWLKLALLIREDKTYPWPKASNIKYPLMATAAMQFSARAYPALVPADGNIVKAKVVRKDKQGIFQQKAIRVAAHMSYQVLCKMPNWEEDMDKLLMTMAISGICFKETFHSAALNTHISQLVYPENFCVNYHAKSLESAYRKTRILKFTDNEIKAKVNRDEDFLDIDYGDPVVTEATDRKKSVVVALEETSINKATPHTFFAVHTYWDLDEDGYEEPYIITIHEGTQKVVKIVARWDSDGVERDAKGKIVCIKPVEYFTDFPFIPNPDGSIYALGFGSLLGPLNESVNTLINQLIDAGTLNNLSGGFIGKNLRIKMGQVQLIPGEWRVVSATGEEMQKSFYPVPTKEPSPVLMNLMNMLVTSGNQLASIAEIFVGKMPGQNTPATTTQETIQQGMAVFTAIYKRVYRSLEKEFKKIYRLNRIVPGILDQEIFYSGEQLQESDYNGTEDYIIPGADPTGDSSTVRQMKLQAIGQLLQMGTIDPMAYTKRFLEAQDIPNWEELIPPPQPPQPDPAAMAAQQEAEMKQQESQAKMQILQTKAGLDAQAKQADIEAKQQTAMIDAQVAKNKLEFEQTMQALKAQGEQMKLKQNMVAQSAKQRFESLKQQSDVVANHVKNKQSIEHAERQQRIKEKNGNNKK
jgi:chaperonin GroES